MAQHDYVIDNQTAPNFRSDLNSALLAIASNNSGSSAPTVTYANMMWYDTTNNILKMRNEADDAWINIGTLNQTTNVFEVANLPTLSQATWEAGTSTTESLISPAKVRAAISASIYSATTSALDSTTTVIPVDTSVPLSTEGKQALSIPSVVVTSGQKVKVSFSGMISNNTNNVVTTLAVFRGTTCIGTAVTLATTANLVEIVGATLVDSPAAGTYTYSLRFGPQSNTAYLNANALGQAIFGSAGRTDLVLEVF